MQAYPSSIDLQGTTLILPVVAVGNVAQLAADLLINTLRCPRTARLEDDSLLPAVGYKAYDHVSGLSTAMELYKLSGRQAAVVQQRAPAAPGTQNAFAERLAAFVKQAGVKEVLVLGSIDAALRRDEQLVGPQLRCWSPDASAASSMLERCMSAAPSGVPQLEPSFFQDRPLEQQLLPPWPLLRQLHQEGVPCAAILSFSSEGDNVGDAFVLASAAAKAAGLGSHADEASTSMGSTAQQQAWVPPRSWQYLFGASAAVY